MGDLNSKAHAERMEQGYLTPNFISQVEYLPQKNHESN